ncbi:DREV methyltransferase [Ostertagia ostertagi]
MRLYRGQRIAASFLHREQAQKQYLTIDRSLWYEPKIHLASPLLQSTFFLSFLDADTESFLEDSFTTSSSVCLQLYYAFVSFIMSFFLSKTSINGVLNRGGMFLFSTHQLQEFLNISSDWDPHNKQLLDLGAGDGGITKKLSAFFPNVYVTEMSQARASVVFKVMQWRLRNEGFHIEDVEGWSSSSRRYDMISALNLLDRMRSGTTIHGNYYEISTRLLFGQTVMFLLAVVLPIHQYVEFHPSRKTTEADVRLAVEGSTIEEQASFLVEREFSPAGFDLVRWTKLPYLCEGDYYKVCSISKFYFLVPFLNEVALL